jgi:hypothetical protein
MKSMVLQWLQRGDKKLLKIAKTGDFELKGHCSTD